MTTKVVYKGGLRTAATHLKSETKLITDAPVDNRGQGASFSPTDLVATALGSCILTIMGIKAEDKGIDIAGAEVAVTKVMASNPRRIAKIKIELSMPDGNYSDRDKKLLTAAAHHCPVANSLHPDLEEEVIIKWYD